MQELKANHEIGARSGCDVNLYRFIAINRSWLRMLTFTLVLMLSSLFVLFAVRTVVAQDRTIKAEGILTEVSTDSVIIDQGGYIISRLTKVYNMDGNRIRIEDMQVPVKVKFEYEYTGEGPVILSMRAVGV
jgi:hypothetical protein